jgi:hypothetical protein
MGDSRHMPALGAPYGVENFKLSISGYGTPDIFGYGCKSIPGFQKSSSDAFFATNKTFAVITVKSFDSYLISFTARISHHFRGGRHFHIPFGIASGAEFLLHMIHRFFRESV